MKGHVKGHIAIITDDVKKSHEAAVDRLYPKLDPLVISSFLEEVQTSLIEKNYIVPASILGKRIMAFNYAYQMYQSYTSVFPDQPVSEKINKYWDHLVMGIEIAKREGYYIGEGEYAKYRNAVVLDDHVFFGNEGRKKRKGIFQPFSLLLSNQHLNEFRIS